MVFSVSPSVTVREVDLTSVIPATTTPPAAIAGVFRWGPVQERVLVSSETELANIFGKPFANTTWENVETFFTAADFLAYSNALYVVRAENDAVTANSEFFEAKYPGSLGNEIQVAYVSTSANNDTSDFETVIFEDSNIVDSTITFNSNTMSIEYDTDINDPVVELKVGDTIRIGSDTIGYQDLLLTGLTVVEEEIANTNTFTYTYNMSFANRYTLPETDPVNLTISRVWTYSRIVETAPLPGTMHIVVIDRNGEISGTRGLVLEKYENVSTTSTAKLADGTSNYYKSKLEQSSNWIKATSATVAIGSANREYVNLSNGTDGLDESDIAFGDLARAYDLFKEGNEVDISFVLQGKARTSNLANYIISNIVEFRRDAIAFISPEKEDVVDVSNPQTQMNNVIAFRDELQSSSYWFMDTGYKRRYDKYNDAYRWVPMNGDMAGLASKVDPWESPAGYRKGLLRNVVKLAFNPNKTQRDILYGKDINPVITQVGQGTLLFGDKTGLGTATGSAFTRINVRRLFITVEKAIATISARFLFEFNDEFTQNQFRNIVNPYLRDIQGKRGIIDFRVVSDGTINTPDVIDRNIFRSNIFIKPARSINFIELTFVATRTGVEFEELVGLQF